MERLRIVAGGNTEQAKANARGKLFEKITAEVLRHCGYEIDKHSINVNYSGMEIDIEGKARLTGIPLYAECKCYSSDLATEKLQTFYGKYMTRWFKDSRCQGLFVAIPGINSHAMGFYRENCCSNDRITMRALQEPQVLEALTSNKVIIGGDEIGRMIEAEIGSPGDRLLICSEMGFFWLQHVVPIGSGIASKIQLFDSMGHRINDESTLNYLGELVPEIKDFDLVTASSKDHRQSRPKDDALDQVVELRGSSACFEYQFPASPEFFVGRFDALKEICEFVTAVINNVTSSRGILFEANSGWGKSSLVLATVAKLIESCHYAVAIDSRSASTSQFLLRTVEHIIQKYGDFHGSVDKELIISGFDGAFDGLVEIGKALKKQDKLLFVCFDQFENIFYQPDLLQRIAHLCLKIADARTNIVLGFSWKTDFIGLTRDFPYRWRDIIISCCQTHRLKQFSEVETNALLDRLGLELNSTLRKDLRFLLSEFSQGYPWLLKKLCAHVRKQRHAGIPQAEMARGLLNVEQLFLEDLEGLSNRQEDALRRVARLAPVSISDVGDDFTPEILQSLVDRRLIVRVGLKYDVYWDIFRDYLNTGKLPIEEIYLLRSQVGSILKAVAILQKAGSTLDIGKFKGQAGLSDGAFLNIARELRLLQIAKVESDVLSLSLPVGCKETEIHQHLRDHLNQRLPRNRCVYNALGALSEKGEIQLSELATILRNDFPYISASEKTWETYARVLATWLDISDLAVWDDAKSKIGLYRVGSQIRDRTISFAPKRSQLTVPYIQFAPVLQVATRIVSAAQKNEAVDWAGLTKSTIYKSLSVLEEMKLIIRKPNSIYLNEGCYTFVLNQDKRREIARLAALGWPIFSAFITILEQNASRALSHRELADSLISFCDLSWKPTTAETNAKIMLDWARHLGIAAGIHAESQRGQFKAPPKEIQMPLFGNFESKHKD